MVKPSPARHFRALPSLVCVRARCLVARWHSVPSALRLPVLHLEKCWCLGTCFSFLSFYLSDPFIRNLSACEAKGAEVPVSAGGPFQGLRGAGEEPGVMVAVCRVSVSVWAWG